MFKRLFSFARKPNREVVETLYGAIVASARQPVFYDAWKVPDTPLGRFEMLSLHMFLLLYRARGADGTLPDIAQDLTDEFFLDVDHSLRELGIGDLGVPKRIKKLARMFYGRTRAYDEALGSGDRAALREALIRNVRPDTDHWPEADALAAYVFRAAAVLAGQPAEALTAGRVAFPPAGEGEP